ncbi:MAG: hypothetical protein AB7O94_21770 [Hyphomicrobiaceae bacterium]
MTAFLIWLAVAALVVASLAFILRRTHASQERRAADFATKRARFTRAPVAPEVGDTFERRPKVAFGRR